MAAAADVDDAAVAAAAKDSCHQFDAAGVTAAADKGLWHLSAGTETRRGEQSESSTT